MTATNTDALVPSCARTSVLAVQTRPVNIVQMAPKASADCLDYSLDFTDVLKCTGDAPSAVNSAVVLTAQQETYDLVVMQSSVSGQLATLILASGQPGTFQQVQVEVATTQGRILSVVMQIQITDLTKATLPPSSFPADVTTNGKVLIAGDTALPTGYTSNGRVVMLTTDQAPVGTPDFESVTAGTYAGDGSGLNVTVSAETQTIAEWITAIQKTAGQAGVGIAKIEASQGAVTTGESSTVTLTATLTDGTTSVTTFTAPAGAAGATGAAGADGKDGTNGTNGTDGSNGESAYQVAVSAGYSGTETEWLASLVGATGAKGDTGATGAAGSDADVTSANIATALGYTPANPSKFLALSPTALASLQTITAPSDTTDTNGYSFQVANNGGDLLQLGVINAYGVKFFGLKSTDGSTGVYLTDNSGNASYLAQHTSTDYSTEIYAGNLAVDTGYGSGGFRIINKDSGNFQWQIWAQNTATAPSPLYISAGTTAGTAWQDPAVSFSPTTNTATFLNEPVVSTVYTFATLPTSPADWQRAIVTDKAIGSGSTGVMAMWNPNTKAWTGLSGEALT